MGKRAVIYVRTSSEQQGEKSSPIEQESECRQLAKENGFTVVHVYKDIEKYRVKNKLVEPSGTRSDRPGLLAMLEDAAQDQFDVILAWREDRLYRGMRAMLLVLEGTQENGISILLARETFDPKIAPLKAWVAQMELDGIKQRMTMGAKARLRSGKANTGQDRYGYRRKGEVIEIVEEEAKWVRQIFAWYIDHVHASEIRTRLIAADAPQKGSHSPRKIHWARSSIQGILKGAREYASGVKLHHMSGEVFEIAVPPIIDEATYERFLKVRKENKTHPAHNLKKDYLIGGLLHCHCDRKWAARSDNRTYGVTARGRVRKNPRGRYCCPVEHDEMIHPECPHQISSKKADDYVWNKVCDAINNPEILISRAREAIEKFKANSDTVREEQDRIQKQLDGITMERQWVITQARRGGITESDMDYQLGALTLQEASLKREQSSMGKYLDFDQIGDWETKAYEYFADLQEGIASLNYEPENDDDRKEIYKLKRTIVVNLVEKAVIQKDREIVVWFRFDVLKFLRGGFGEIKNNGTFEDQRCGDAH